MSAKNCAWLDEMAPELALGLLTGSDRAAALEHIEGCARCQAEVAALTGVAEQILLLAPELPPPAGFESRVLARIGSVSEDLRPSGASGTDRPGRIGRGDGSGRAWWRWRRSVLGAVAAAAAVVVLLAAVAAAVLRADDDGSVLVADMVSARGNVVGEATLTTHEDEVPDVEIDMAEWIDDVQERGNWPEGPWHLEVEDRAGSEAVYTVSLARSPAEATLADPQLGSEPLDLDHITKITVVDHTGQAWCWAEFR